MPSTTDHRLSNTQTTSLHNGIKQLITVQYSIGPHNTVREPPSTNLKRKKKPNTTYKKAPSTGNQEQRKKSNQVNLKPSSSHLTEFVVVVVVEGQTPFHWGNRGGGGGKKSIQVSTQA